ncbi:nucleotide exchange factor GrpE [bacterium]|nr:MAG: nucleotide exchange factor GrpE [bacterium]
MANEEQQKPATGEETAEVEKTCEDLGGHISELEGVIAKLKNDLLYERAELENFKRRTEKRYLDSVRTAAEQVVRDIIPVLDNLERALEHAGSGDESLAEGIAQVVIQLREALARHGVEEIPALGQKFDPNVHEALAQMPGAEAGIVLVVHEKGYTLGGKLLRPSKVVVSALAHR